MNQEYKQVACPGHDDYVKNLADKTIKTLEKLDNLLSPFYVTSLGIKEDTRPLETIYKSHKNKQYFGITYDQCINVENAINILRNDDNNFDPTKPDFIPLIINLISKINDIVDYDIKDINRYDKSGISYEIETQFKYAARNSEYFDDDNKLQISHIGILRTRQLISRLHKQLDIPPIARCYNLIGTPKHQI